MSEYPNFENSHDTHNQGRVMSKIRSSKRILVPAQIIQGYSTMLEIWRISDHILSNTSACVPSFMTTNFLLEGVRLEAPNRDSCLEHRASEWQERLCSDSADACWERKWARKVGNLSFVKPRPQRWGELRVKFLLLRYLMFHLGEFIRSFIYMILKSRRIQRQDES